MYTFVNVTLEESFDVGLSTLYSLMTYDRFRMAWYNYLDLLDIAFDTGFCCSVCQMQPDTVVFDATTLSYRKEALPLGLSRINDTKEKSIKRARFVLHEILGCLCPFVPGFVYLLCFFTSLRVHYLTRFGNVKWLSSKQQLAGWLDVSRK